MLTIVLSTLNAMAQHDWENTEALTKYPVFTLLDGTSDANVTTEIGTVQKHLGNPLWEQDRPWEPRIDNGYPNVIHDPADPLGSWRMWYGASLWEYATSEDGIHWTKPDLGMYDLGYFNRDWSHYGTHNNVIMFGNGMGIYKDIHEKDPNKRFKAFGGPSCFFGAGGGANNCTGPIQGTAVSPDGLYWYEAKNVTWPYAAGSQTGPHQKYDTHQNLFWDASKGKYIATTRDLKPFPWRSVAIAESNLEEFSFDTTYAPPSVLQGTANEQPYSQITFPYYGIYLGLTSVYDAQYGRTEGRVHLRLSWSRDAEHWNWVDQGALTGKDFIPLGRTGWKHNAFDSHIIFAAAYPKQMADDIRVYYMGGNGPHSGPRNSSFGLATLRRDGFVSASGSGTVRTTPIQCTGKTLVVTADVESSLSLGVQGVDGLSTKDSNIIVGTVTDKEVTFASGEDLSGLVGQKIVLELVLDEAAVFTIGFRK